MLEYDQNGRLIKSFGKEGEAPGEFKTIQRVRVVRGDSLLVVDPEVGRVTLLNPTGGYVRSLNIAGTLYDAALATNGDFLVQAGIPSRERIGFTLHRGMFPSGRVVSFGPQRADDGSQTMLTIRSPMATRDETVWVAMYNEYRIERWDAASRRVQAVFKRSVPWFPMWHTYHIGSMFETKPVTRLSDIWIDKANRLWVKVTIADASWPPKVSKAQIEQSHREPMLDWSDKVFDTVIEVLDGTSGKLLATQRFDKFFSGFVGEGLLTSMTENPDGDFITDIWQIALTTPNARGGT